ncbi:Carbohydrate kinase PfkB [Macleaya cordata]|uniref:Carbohydrate kinase PfkB n=1 Tax=Macleaya cordata TaxID=56857 RepID=A0A200PLL0_MACCD|nr:Carbohydrate kinase PfkB [Macleaya cordata]
MVRELQKQSELAIRRVLVVGNYCHDVLIHDDRVIGESLGGASSFISNVLDNLSINCDYVSKVGSDFAYSVSHPPISSSTSMTTLFHAHFSSNRDQDGNQDRILRRIHACDPISPSDLPNSQFDFGLAVGVAGEILPETLERMIGICSVVFVDIQALIRVFDPIDGTVKLVNLKESGFFHLLPRIGFLKASAEEAPYVDIEEARKWCYVVVTDGKDGCRVYSKDGKLQISPFPAVQIDPTGAGDSFLGGFVAGFIQGLAVPDAALLGNFFGSLTVGQIGVPKFDFRLMQKVKDELQQRRMQCIDHCERRDVEAEFRKSVVENQDFQEFLVGVTKLPSTYLNEEDQLDSQHSPAQAIEKTSHYQNNGHKLLLNPVYKEESPPVEGQRRHEQG